MLSPRGNTTGQITKAPLIKVGTCSVLEQSIATHKRRPVGNRWLSSVQRLEVPSGSTPPPPPTNCQGLATSVTCAVKEASVLAPKNLFMKRSVLSDHAHFHLTKPP